MKKCNSLEEVRKEIDDIDTKIVELIAKRNDYIKQAASFKESVDEVKSEERIDYIMQRVRQKAIELNMNPNMIEELFKIMIDEMVETEIAEFRNGGNF
ncbi:MAG: chorismate mutase [Epsilonproteobacteria bacterium]|nr:chorismate mutase [Campylobacterota bacterium]